MKLRSLCLALACAATLGHGARAAEDVRFSKTLAPAEFSLIGLAQLSSDQLATLDALVRRDLAQAGYVTKPPRPARFSDRLSADERHAAGLTLLDKSQLAALDARVQSLVPAAHANFALVDRGAPGVTPYISSRRGVEVHGEVDLMVGAGSHGYSEYGGGMAVEVDDPSHGLAIGISYSELHTKGGWLGRGCRDGYFDYPELGLASNLGR